MDYRTIIHRIFGFFAMKFHDMRILFFVSILIAPILSKSQIGVGQWHDHLPYAHGVNVEIAGDRIFCLTSDGLFEFSLNDESTQRISKINGLSDVRPTYIEYLQNSGDLIIGYENGNLDIIRDNTVYNISDIKRKPLTGDKKIYNIFPDNGLVYLSCGFGIVVLDPERMEIKDTYFIGPGGSYLRINDLTANSSHFYAATESGVYKASKSDPNLVNYANWSKVSNIPNSSQEFSKVEVFEENILAIFDRTNFWAGDTLYYFNGTSWHTVPGGLHNLTNIVCVDGHIYIFDLNAMSDRTSITGQETPYYWFSGNSSAPRDADLQDNGTLWIADNGLGLVKKDFATGLYSHFFPNGPFRIGAIGLATEKNTVWIAPGGKNASWNNMWNPGELYFYSDNTWKTLDAVSYPEIADGPDMCELAIDPNNTSHVFAGSYGGGVFEFIDAQLVHHYTDTNSTLQNIGATGTPYLRIGGMTFDEDGNLWVTNCGVTNTVSVRKANGTWKGFAYNTAMDAALIGDIMYTLNGHHWVILPKGKGLFAFNVNGTIDNESDDQKQFVSIVNDEGEIISNEVFSIAEDKDGAIWVGTNKGVVVYYSPENVFNGSPIIGQQIKIPNEIPGQANYLLEAETVTAIAVDGANRKWFGTESGGVFLMSPDGTEQILHFSEDNSPLLSNTITAISIEPSSGEVFFATDVGVISYRGDATEAYDFFHDVLVFPNPVKPDFDGLIAISGLAANASVKITDIAGNLVYETTANGGEATWNGKTFENRKVSTGVYLVFCTNEDGSQTYVTKILFVN